MRKILKRLSVLALVLMMCIMPGANAFAESPVDATSTYQTRAGAQASGNGTFSVQGTITLEMRETNKNADVYVRVISSKAEDFDAPYYVAWTTPSGHTYTNYNVYGNGEEFYFLFNGGAEKGTHKFYFLRMDGSVERFVATAFIVNA